MYRYLVLGALVICGIGGYQHREKWMPAEIGSRLEAMARQVSQSLPVAGADEPAPPVFRGVLVMAKRELALFEVPGQVGLWQGAVGGTLPGTGWKIAAIDLRRALVTVVVGARNVALAQDTTFAGGRVVPVERPRAAPATAASGASRPAAAPGSRVVTAPRKFADLPETVDVSCRTPPLPSLARRGKLTLVMVTSPG